jgi:putative transposase
MKSETYSNRKEKPGRMLSGRLVFHTKYNRPMLKAKIQKRAKEIIKNVLEDLDCKVIKIIVQPNYVFLQFNYSPKLAMAKIANKVKGISSCLLRREFPELKKQNPKALWAPKYSVYS